MKYATVLILFANIVPCFSESKDFNKGVCIEGFATIKRALSKKLIVAVNEYTSVQQIYNILLDKTKMVPRGVRIKFRGFLKDNKTLHSKSGLIEKVGRRPATYAKSLQIKPIDANMEQCLRDL